MRKAFVVSDIHGMYESFEQLLRYWQQEDELVILGDMIDRGPQSLEVLQKIMQLQQTHKVTVVMGNHDQMLLDFLRYPKEAQSRYERNGGMATLQSLLAEAFARPIEEYVSLIPQKRPDELAFLAKSKRFYVFNQVLFTHAGFDTRLEDWQLTAKDDFIWIREHYTLPNKTSYTNVFGHTPTKYINPDETNRIWLGDEGRYVAIDGGAVYGGQLNGLLIREDGQIVQTYAIPSTDK